MCLIAVKPAGIPMPTEEFINKAFTANHDGFGLAYSLRSNVRILKGAMTLEETYALAAQVPTPEERTVVFHFRTATQGSVCRENTQPLPIAASKGKLRSLEVSCQTAVAHNGIIGIYYPFDLMGEGYGESSDYLTNYLERWKASKADLSDTQKFIAEYLVDLEDNLLEQPMADLIAGLTESRFVFLSKHNRFTIAGHFFEYSGLLLSNGLPVTPAVMPKPNANCRRCGCTDTLYESECGKICTPCAVALGLSFEDVPLETEVLPEAYDPDIGNEYDWLRRWMKAGKPKV